MRIFASIILSCSVLLTGCLASVNQLVNSVNEPFGYHTAPTLAGSPQSSGCTDSRCLTLDRLESELYSLARSRKITWLQLVDAFYSERARLYPKTNDRNGVSELFAYQRMLAELMDQRKITEPQWSYLIQQKNSEIQARIQAGGL